ncbi:MAG: glycosyltransferase, partial [Ilumatobacteraceae bacterium]
MTSPVIVGLHQPAIVAIEHLCAGDDVIVVGTGAGNGADPGDDVVDRLRRAAGGDGVATASPVPIASCRHVTPYDTHEASPPPASLALPCAELCLIRATAAASVLPLIEVDGSADVAVLLGRLGESLLQHGWRHVAAPGVALAWDPSTFPPDDRPIAGWNPKAVRSMVGDANTGLEAHRSWAAARIDGVHVVLDGICLTDDPYTGTQHLVVEVARHMAELRPDATVSLAVGSAVVDSVRGRLLGTGVHVVDRARRVDADVMYRPYQMLYAGELDAVIGTGRRTLVGQLDMIGFSNPFYHPSEQLFFFARNLQRHLMRVCDGVTFISRFGLDSTAAELPDLDLDRLHVVSCGADPDVSGGGLRPDRTIGPDDDFLVSLSSTFWHKNRVHAISTFAAMVDQHGYEGQLVIGGPEPYFGRSTGAEDELVARLPVATRSRVHRWNHVTDDEKWWLLRHARAVLYPSVIEGFGLVPFEAAVAGTPCFVYRGTAQRELLGHTEAAIDSWDPADWADRVTTVTGDSQRTSALISAVVEVAGEHTWRRCAERTWEAIDRTLAMPRRSIHHDDGSA